MEINTVDSLLIRTPSGYEKKSNYSKYEKTETYNFKEN